MCILSQPVRCVQDSLHVVRSLHGVRLMPSLPSSTCTKRVDLTSIQRLGTGLGCLGEAQGRGIENDALKRIKRLTLMMGYDGSRDAWRRLSNRTLWTFLHSIASTVLGTNIFWTSESTSNHRDGSLVLSIWQAQIIDQVRARRHVQCGLVKYLKTRVTIMVTSIFVINLNRALGLCSVHSMNAAMRLLFAHEPWSSRRDTADCSAKVFKLDKMFPKTV